jgi:DNA-binding NarL/FixJ family response regulator
VKQLLDGETELELDLILLDLHMPGCTGFSGLIALRNAAPSVPIIIVSASTSANVVNGAMTYGAMGFISKSLSRGEMQVAIEQVLSGDVSVCLTEAERDSGIDPGRAGAVPRLDAQGTALTPGELRVLDLLAKGKSNKIIAYELGIRESTVKAHITAILRKLKVHSRTQAVLAAQDLQFGTTRPATQNGQFD